MNRRTFITTLAVTTACAIPAVGALLSRNSFERTLTAEAAKPRGITLAELARVNKGDHRLAVIEMFEQNNDLLRTMPYVEVKLPTMQYVEVKR